MEVGDPKCFISPFPQVTRPCSRPISGCPSSLEMPLLHSWMSPVPQDAQVLLLVVHPSCPKHTAGFPSCPCPPLSVPMRIRHPHDRPGATHCVPSSLGPAQLSSLSSPASSLQAAEVRGQCLRLGRF